LKSLVASGLDPYAGLMHAPKPGRKSLVYDFSEIYKPLAVHAVLQASRIRKLRTFRGSSKLTPKTIEALIKQLYHRLHVLGERYYRRKNIWIHPMNEANKLKQAIVKGVPYNPYTYKPPA
jgi:CRISPR-associated protein Cas1